MTNGMKNNAWKKRVPRSDLLLSSSATANGISSPIGSANAAKRNVANSASHVRWSPNTWLQFSRPTKRSGSSPASVMLVNVKTKVAIIGIAVRSTNPSSQGEMNRYPQIASMRERLNRGRPGSVVRVDSSSTIAIADRTSIDMIRGGPTRHGGGRARLT